MELGLSGRTALVVASGPDAEACAWALQDEGVRLVDRAGEADILVTGARGRPGSELIGLDLDEVVALWAPVNVAVSVYKEALPRMTQQRWGRLVWVGSAAARSLDADDDDAGAVITLGARGLHKVLAAEAGAAQVTANTVLRSGAADPMDVAAAVLFLCSEPAGYLTGVTLTVDAGVGSAVF